jgi:hypothetical protein
MGKPRAARSLADQLADFEDPTPKGMNYAPADSLEYRPFNAYFMFRF